MCGIAGIWSKEQRHVPEHQIKKMANAMSHRGPEAEGFFSSPGLSLVHRRLKIIDLSDSANQPFTDGEDALVFNGEIFNYLSLRKEIEKYFRFTTNSDTEVLFRALQKWDDKVFDRIDGQFAFAFFRAATKTLTLARDRVGICPLYVHETDSELYFASEIKPILSIKKFTLDGSGVADYFLYR